MSPVERARSVFWASLRSAEQLPVAEQARLAHHAGGPSLRELEARIRQRRGGDLIAA